MRYGETWKMWTSYACYKDKCVEVQSVNSSIYRYTIVCNVSTHSLTHLLWLGHVKLLRLRGVDESVGHVCGLAPGSGRLLGHGLKRLLQAHGEVEGWLLLSHLEGWLWVRVAGSGLSSHLWLTRATKPIRRRLETETTGIISHVHKYTSQRTVE